MTFKKSKLIIIPYNNTIIYILTLEMLTIYYINLFIFLKYYNLLRLGKIGKFEKSICSLNLFILNSLYIIINK